MTWSPRRGEQNKRRGRGSAPGQGASPGVSPHRTKTFRAPGHYQSNDDLFTQTWPPVSPRAAGSTKFGNGQGLQAQTNPLSPRSSGKCLSAQAPSAAIPASAGGPSSGSGGGGSSSVLPSTGAQMSPRRMASPVVQVYEHSGCATPRQPGNQEQPGAWMAVRQTSAPRLLQANTMPPQQLNVQSARTGNVHLGAHTPRMPPESLATQAFLTGNPLVQGVQGIHTN